MEIGASETRGEEPRHVRLGSRRLAVLRVQDEWRIVDEWWSHPIRRRYLQVVLEGGRLLTLFQDRLTGQWYTQRY